jgi:transposase
MENKFIKKCPKCDGVQTYTTKNRLECSIRENWKCNKCSSTHKKKTYDGGIINEIVKQYESGVSFSKIALKLKISRDNIKSILIKKNIWIEGRNRIKKEFTEIEIKDIITKYENEGLSCDIIAKHYGVSKRPINRLLKEKGLLKKGLSNGLKIDLTNEQKNIIKKLYIKEYKNSVEIADEIGMNKNYVNKYLHNCGFRRDKSKGTSIGLVKRWGNRGYDEYLNSLSEFKEYKKKVISITNKQPIYKLLNYNKRGVSGVDDNYHLDHKFSILRGFKEKIDPNIIGEIKNLEFIPWEENVKKRTNCSITINELIIK